jgi:SAM-dependent methyltransferase
MANHTSMGQPSDWVRRWLPIVTSSGQASLLDWACGSGRHSIFAASLGYRVTALDAQRSEFAADYPQINWLQTDLESGEINLASDQRFDVILVTNYLYRPRLAALVNHLAPGGTFIYETFAVGNATFGRPKNPDFLLRPGELFSLCERHHLHVLGYEDGVTATPARVQRVVAKRLFLAQSTDDAMQSLLLK